MPEASLNPREIGALVALVDQDRLGEAERRARALLEAHPGAGMLWKILSVTLVRQGKDALQALHRAAELMPQDAEAHANLGAALHDRGQWAQAAASLFRALALRPDDAGTLVDAANALKGLGRAREAVPLYRRAIELQPRLAEAHNNLGNAFLALGQTEDAAGCYRRDDMGGVIEIIAGGLQEVRHMVDELFHNSSEGDGGRERPVARQFFGNGIK